MDKQYYVYILANNAGSVLYTGVTNDLKRRLFQHKNKLAEGFAKKYNIDKLVYYAICERIAGAILEEKRIKGGSRQKKLDLIDGFNREWRDLYEWLYANETEIASLRSPRRLRLQLLRPDKSALAKTKRELFKLQSSRRLKCCSLSISATRILP